uniref:2Fe-2S ferredoxin n=1 Tax=Lotharella oceanica TaxID=641309 RepID=A0A7S2TNB4_9EUKA
MIINGKMAAIRRWTWRLRRPVLGLTIPRRLFSGDTIKVTFLEEGEPFEATARIGQSILEAAHDNEVELEGACDAQLACSTCHVILPQEVYDSLEEPCEEELDMLDLAMDVHDTSRLGCQVKLTKEMEGMEIVVPQSLDAR